LLFIRRHAGGGCCNKDVGYLEEREKEYSHKIKALWFKRIYLCEKKSPAEGSFKGRDDVPASGGRKGRMTWNRRFGRRGGRLEGRRRPKLPPLRGGCLKKMGWPPSHKEASWAWHGRGGPLRGTWPSPGQTALKIQHPKGLPPQRGWNVFTGRYSQGVRKELRKPSEINFGVFWPPDTVFLKAFLEARGRHQRGVRKTTKSMRKERIQERRPEIKGEKHKDYWGPYPSAREKKGGGGILSCLEKPSESL